MMIKLFCYSNSRHVADTLFTVFRRTVQE